MGGRAVGHERRPAPSRSTAAPCSGPPSAGSRPGFAYLVGLPERCHLPRRPRPRPEVPAGAVAVAGEFTGVYPRPSPGGWHLLGRTTRPMWDPSRPEPALVAPGIEVRFVAVEP